MQQNRLDPITEGATAVITHQVDKDKHAEYEEWLNEISPHCKSSPGHLDLNVIRPIAVFAATTSQAGTA